MPEFDYGPWRLEWDNIGEGTNGEYDAEDPTDVPLLRATLFYLVDQEYYPVDDSSYCTLTPVGTPTKVLIRLSNLLFSQLPSQIADVSDPNNLRIPTNAMANWTWDTRIDLWP